MDYFRYIFYLGIVYVVFSLIWFFIAQGLKFLLRRGQEEKPWEGYVLKVIQYYFIASLTILKATEFIQTKTELYKNSVFLYLTGGLVLYLYLYGKYERSKQFAGLKSTFTMMRGGKVNTISTAEKTKYVPHIIGVTILFYLVSLQFPQLIDHRLNHWFLVNINDFYDTVIIKWILGIIGFFFIISMVTKGLSATGELVQQLIGIITGKPYEKKKPKNPFENMGNMGGFGPFGDMGKQGNPFEQKNTEKEEPEEEVDLEGEYVDFEIVDEEEDEDDEKK